MKISFEHYGSTYEVTPSNNDLGSDEVKELFGKLLFVAGYCPKEIESPEGAYVFVGEDEMVISQEKYDELYKKAAKYDGKCV